MQSVGQQYTAAPVVAPAVNTTPDSNKNKSQQPSVGTTIIDTDSSSTNQENPSKQSSSSSSQKRRRRGGGGGGCGCSALETGCGVFTVMDAATSTLTKVNTQQKKITTRYDDLKNAWETTTGSFDKTFSACGGVVEKFM